MFAPSKASHLAPKATDFHFYVYISCVCALHQLPNSALDRMQTIPTGSHKCLQTEVPVTYVALVVLGERREKGKIKLIGFIKTLDGIF